MNLFRVRCAGCNTLYNDFVSKGKTILLHAGVISLEDNRPLPTPRCVKSYDYVVFQECGHCSPEVFEDCRACDLGYIGKVDIPGSPTKEQCSCRYAIIEPEAKIKFTDTEWKIADNKIEDALIEMKDMINKTEDEELAGEVLQLLSRFNRVNKNRELGSVSFEDYNIQMNRIGSSVISLLNEIKK